MSEATTLPTVYQTFVTQIISPNFNISIKTPLVINLPLFSLSFFLYPFIYLIIFRRLHLDDKFIIPFIQQKKVREPASHPRQSKSILI